MYASDYLETKILKLAQNEAMTKPANGLYLALLAQAPDESTGVGTELGYTGYGRKQITFTEPAAESSGGYSFSNSAQITFGKNTGSSSGTAKYVGVYDTAGGDAGNGNLYLYGQLSSELAVESGVAPVVQANALKWIFTGNISNYYKQLIMNCIRGSNSSIPGFLPYLGLLTGNPDSTTESGSEFTIGTNNYARTLFSFGTNVSTSGTSLKITNEAQITTNTASGTGWGSGSTMKCFGIYDGSTSSAHAYLYGTSSVQTIMTAGKSVVVDAQTLNVLVD